MASLVASGKANNAGSVTLNTSGGDIAFCTVGGISGSPPDDSNVMSWVLADVDTPGGSAPTRLWYSQGGTFGAGHIFAPPIGGSFCSIAVEVWSGSLASALDQHSPGAAAGSSTSVQSNAITPGSNDQVVIMAVGTASLGTSTGYTTDSGFTDTASADGVSGVQFGAAMSYSNQTTATLV